MKLGKEPIKQQQKCLPSAYGSVMPGPSLYQLELVTERGPLRAKAVRNQAMLTVDTRNRAKARSVLPPFFPAPVQTSGLASVWPSR